MKITGQILKENRERKGVSISEVALATKINNRTIMAIEDGDSEKLPPKTFLRGFVRAYATYLGLDVESVLNTFYEEMGTTIPKSAIPTVQASSPDTAMPKAGVNRAKSSSEADDAINPKTSLAASVGVVAAILILVVLIMVFKKKMDSYESEAVIDPAKVSAVTGPSNPSLPTVATASIPSATSVVLAPLPSSSARSWTAPTETTSATSTPTSAVATNATAAGPVFPTAAPTAVATTAAQPESTPAPTATPTPISTPVATASPAKARATPKPTASPKPKPSATAKPKAARAQEILIEALGDVDIEAQIDSEPSKHIHLNGDQVQTIKALKKVILQISNAGAVNITVNGSDRGVPGDLGKSRRLEYP
jgi:cytoskeleton protein RodZ